MCINQNFIINTLFFQEYMHVQLCRCHTLASPTMQVDQRGLRSLLHACPIALKHGTHTLVSNSPVFHQYCENRLNITSFNWFISVIGRPGKFLPPPGVHFTNTSSPKNDNFANFTASVGTFDSPFSLGNLAMMSAAGFSFCLFISEESSAFKIFVMRIGFGVVACGSNTGVGVVVVGGMGCCIISSCCAG